MINVIEYLDYFYHEHIFKEIIRLLNIKEKKQMLNLVIKKLNKKEYLNNNRIIVL